MSWENSQNSAILFWCHPKSIKTSAQKKKSSAQNTSKQWFSQVLIKWCHPKSIKNTPKEALNRKCVHEWYYRVMFV